MSDSIPIVRVIINSIIRANIDVIYNSLHLKLEIMIEYAYKFVRNLYCMSTACGQGAHIPMCLCIRTYAHMCQAYANTNIPPVLHLIRNSKHVLNTHANSSDLLHSLSYYRK